MRQWVRRWEIKVRWDSVANSPAHSVTYQAYVRPARLRAMLAMIRGDPHVVSYRYGPVWVLEGDEPSACRRGHSYRGGSATRPRRDWIPCACGGHLVLTCVWPDCGDTRIDPDVDGRCDRAGRAAVRHRKDGR